LLNKTIPYHFRLIDTIKQAKFLFFIPPANFYLCAPCQKFACALPRLIVNKPSLLLLPALAALGLITQCQSSKPATTATTTAPTSAPVATPKEYRYTTTPNDPLGVRVYKLDNGLTVYLSDYKNAPRIQTYIWFSRAPPS
jgi:hypothetical protein